MVDWDDPRTDDVDDEDDDESISIARIFPGLGCNGGGGGIVAGDVAREDGADEETALELAGFCPFAI